MKVEKSEDPQHVGSGCCAGGSQWERCWTTSNKRQIIYPTNWNSSQQADSAFLVAGGVWRPKGRTKKLWKLARPQWRDGRVVTQYHGNSCYPSWPAVLLWRFPFGFGFRLSAFGEKLLGVVVWVEQQRYGTWRTNVEESLGQAHGEWQVDSRSSLVLCLSIFDTDGTGRARTRTKMTLFRYVIMKFRVPPCVLCKCIHRPTFAYLDGDGDGDDICGRADSIGSCHHDDWIFFELLGHMIGIVYLIFWLKL